MTHTEKLKLDPAKYAAFRARRNLGRKQRYHDDEGYRLSESARKNAYYEANHDKVDTKNASWAKTNPEQRKLISRTSAKKKHCELRKEFISVNGNICACCGENHQEFFTLDHIESIKKRSRSGAYREAKNDNWSTKKYQLLCMGCNLAKGTYGVCPHVIIPKTTPHFKLKLKVIEEYGSKCKCCSEINPYFLVIDHINGGGTAHKKSIKEKSIIRWLYNNNYPKDGFRLLCANCNHSFGIYGECPHAKQ